ncbi:MAG: hypothetical protein N2645_15925 [Clostridia bacterium]|nr:hypothetical protein [Clostridia bacterium]
MNKKIILILFILIIASWAGNIVYYHSQLLPEPLFLKHYYQISAWRISNNVGFTYIINKNRNLDVVGIELPGIGYYPIQNNQQNIMPGITFSTFTNQEFVFTHHILKKVILPITEDDVKKALTQGQDEYVTKEIIVHYSNGDRKTIGIGEICIYKDTPWENHLFANFSNYGSNSSAGKTLASPIEAIKVKGLEIRYKELLSSILNVYVDHSKDIPASAALKPVDRSTPLVIRLPGVKLSAQPFPIKLSPSDSFGINYDFAFYGQNSALAYNCYQIDYQLALERKTGKIQKESFGCFQYTPELHDKNIKKYIESRRKG